MAAFPPPASLRLPGGEARSAGRTRAYRYLRNRGVPRRPEPGFEVISGCFRRGLRPPGRRPEQPGPAWLSCARHRVLQARPRAKLVRRHTRKSTPNTRVATFEEIIPAE